MKQHITLKINKKAIKQKECIKYLGVLIESSWKHILNTSNKNSQAIGIMYKLRPFLTLKLLLFMQLKPGDRLSKPNGRY